MLVNHSCRGLSFLVTDRPADQLTAYLLTFQSCLSCSDGDWFKISTLPSKCPVAAEWCDREAFRRGSLGWDFERPCMAPLGLGAYFLTGRTNIHGICTYLASQVHVVPLGFERKRTKGGLSLSFRSPRFGSRRCRCGPCDTLMLVFEKDT